MTESLSIESYNGIPVRVVDTEIGRAIPAVDVAKALGCSRKNITGLMSENPHLFGKGVTITYPLPTAGGAQDHTCLNQEGLISVLMRVSVGKAGTEEGKKRVEKFQLWARDALSNVVNGKPVEPLVPHQPAKVPEQKTPSQIAYEASRFAKMTNADSRTVLSAMLERAGHGYLVPLLPASDKIPVVPAPSVKPAGWLSASDIGAVIGKRPHEVNTWLYQKGLIIKDGERPGEWRLMPAGRQYGEERLYEPVPGHPVYRVFWRRDVLRLFGVVV